jgi:hypothetical protein
VSLGCQYNSADQRTRMPLPEGKKCRNNEPIHTVRTRAATQPVPEVERWKLRGHMQFNVTRFRTLPTKRRQAAALRNAGAPATHRVNREAFGACKLGCALSQRPTKALVLDYYPGNLTGMKSWVSWSGEAEGFQGSRCQESLSM